LIYARFNFAACIFNNLIIVAGGYNNDIGYCRAVELYNGESWQIFSHIKFERQGLIIALIQNKLLIIGGQYNKVPVLKSELFDENSMIWKENPSLNFNFLLNSSIGFGSISKQILLFDKNN
jgi:hypothetical protein